MSFYHNYTITVPLNAANKQQMSVPLLWLGTHLLDGRLYASLCPLIPCKLRRDKTILWHDSQMLVESSWNVMAHCDAREGNWRGNWQTEWVSSTLHTTSEHGLSSIITADAHTSAASSRLNWSPCLFKWNRPFRRKTKSGFCACAITFQTQSTDCPVVLIVECSFENGHQTLEFRRLS